MDTRKFQTDAKRLGYYLGAIDGDWGPKTQAAYEALVADAERAQTGAFDDVLQSGRPLCWGKRVSSKFKSRTRHIGALLDVDPDWLMACMAFESGETFSPSIRNAAGSGAVGLVQFMPATARALGTSTEALAGMSPEDQLTFVQQYFMPYRGRLENLGDVYMAILWPKAVGKPDNYVLWDKATRPTTFRQNAGLDLNRDGKITRAECLTHIREKYQKGMREEHYG